MMRNIIFHGELAEFIGHNSLEAKVSTVAETMRFLICNFPQVEAHMAQRYYKIIIGKDEIQQSELYYPMGSSDINIVPVISGAGGNFGKIFLGAALIGASFLFPGAGAFGATSAFGAGASTTGFATAMTTVGTMVSVTGASLVLNGVAEMISPTESPEETERLESYAFSGVTNTDRIGTPIPIAYGRLFVGSSVISSGLDVDQVV